LNLDHQFRMQRVAAAASIPAPGANPLASVTGVLAWPVNTDRSPPRRGVDDELVTAFRNLAAARVRCPLLPLPHLRFAAHAREFVRADPPSKYWERAHRLVPADPELWFLAGEQSMGEGQIERAWANWRRSLELSERYYDTVMALLTAGRAGPIGVAADGIVPDDPELLLRTARRLDPEARAGGPARPLLERAAHILDTRPEPRPASDYYVEGQVARLLGRNGAAAALEKAVLAAPQRMDWRLDYARVLAEDENWDRAVDELRVILSRSTDRQAEDLLKRVERERSIRHEAGTAAAAADNTVSATDGDLNKILPAAVAATVRLTHPRTGHTGSGVAVTRRGNFVYLLTAAHLVPEGPAGDEVEIQFFGPDGRPLVEQAPRRATVKARNADADLAVLWVGGPDVPTLPLCSPNGMRGRRLPMSVLTVGCGAGGPTGIVDRVRAVKFIESPYRANFYEADQPQAAGRSGGPLVDARGYVIGICSGIRGGKGYYVTVSEIHHALRRHGFDLLSPGTRASP
jgi:S1-C subfamily serine protease